MPQLRAIVSGRVQGVYFRAATREVAERLDLDGYVRNRPDGTVEVAASGGKARLEELIAFLHEGPAVARVERVEIEWETGDRHEPGFTVGA